MCSRYFKLDPATGERVDIRPGDAAEVLIAVGGRGIVRQTQYWGFTGIAHAGLVYNARSETALEKRLFRDSMLYRRAAVPAAGFYEWNRAKEKAVFESPSGEKLYFAGFYALCENIPRFVILTTDAGEPVRGVHDRMPLLLREKQLSDWLLEGGRFEELLWEKPLELRREMEFEQQTFDFLH